MYFLPVLPAFQHGLRIVLTGYSLDGGLVTSSAVYSLRRHPVGDCRSGFAVQKLGLEAVLGLVTIPGARHPTHLPQP